MRSRLNLLTLTTAVIGLLLIPATAFAYAPSGDDFITCVAGGDTNIECVAGIFDPGTDVDAEGELNGTMVLDAALTADADGEVSFNFDVPADEEGEVTVTLSGTKNGEAFVLSEAIANVNSDGEVIANAGSDAGLLALGAIGAIALGGGALFVSRRKRTHTTA